MKERIDKIVAEIESFKASSKEHLESFRVKLLGRKGEVTELFEEFKNVEPSRKREFGQKLNELKNKAQEKINAFKERFEGADDASQSAEDLSRPGEEMSLGSRHPISIIRNEIIEIFSRIGFNVSEGPEVEDDWHNFSALNFPENHPARDMQDTFFVSLTQTLSEGEGLTSEDKVNSENKFSLRTHTSSVQVRVMESGQPPIRTISPGRVYRNEAISARAHCFFHQVEGLYIDTDVSFADLKQTLMYFAKEIFGEKTKIRLRPSYFPFTEPSAEMDVSCNICGGKGCNVCKYSGWVEILGCGMVDPNVLDNCKIDSKKFSGFAFGMGVERITMLKYQVNDLRLFSENDVRFLKQFRSA